MNGKKEFLLFWVFSPLVFCFFLLVADSVAFIFLGFMLCYYGFVLRNFFDDNDNDYDN